LLLVASCDLPTVFAMEGGYALDAPVVNAVNVANG
jgi:hypothetical protein